MVFDSKIKELITAAFYNKNDVFLKVFFPDINELVTDEVKSVIFLPGSFGAMKEYVFADCKADVNAEAYAVAPQLLIADIRFMNEPLFRQFLAEKGYRRFVIPFCECADSGEYGYRESFFRIGEFKSECDEFCQLVAFFSPVKSELTDYLYFFGCENAVFAGYEEDTDIRVFEASSPYSKFYQTAYEAEKYAYKKVCIYFNSRSEEADFSLFLSKRGTEHFCIDGSKSPAEKNSILYKYFNSDCCILLATKSFIPESLFLKCDKCIICGMPFSFSHLSRCSLITPDREVSVIYCKDDFIRNRKIAQSFSSKIRDTSVYEKRLKSLLEIKNLLERGQLK